LKLLLSFLLSAISIAAQPPKFPVKIDGESHKLILFSDGTVGGWGDTRDGQLGPRAPIPNSSGHATAFVPIAIPGKARDIAAGARTSYVLLDTGAVLAFGLGNQGQLGCGERCLSGSETPVEVPGLRDVIGIVAGFSSAFAIHRDGSVSMWGGRYLGQGQNLILTPERASGLPPVTQIAIGTGFILALTPQGRVWMAGKLPFGRIFADDPVQPLAEVDGLTDVAGVVATRVAAVLKKDGTV
jgi:alpha-tubulin suppressor-like RCC1 family protein